MTVAFQLPVRRPGQHDRQIVVRVNVRFADAAAEQHERVVEQRAVAVGRVLQLLEQIREHGDVQLVYLDEFVDLLRVALMVRDGVVSI